jgi:hypothetical protein
MLECQNAKGAGSQSSSKARRHAMLQTILLGEGPGIALCANNGPASQPDVGRCVQWASLALQGRFAYRAGRRCLPRYDATARSYHIVTTTQRNSDRVQLCWGHVSAAKFISLYQLCIDRLHCSCCAATDRDTARQCSMFEHGRW